MERLYKLTNADGTTKGPTQWGEGVMHTAKGGGKLCTDAWLHAYRDPLQAVFMAPRYGYSHPDAVLWECEGEVGVDDGTKVGCTKLTTLRRADKPTMTREQCVEVAIRAAMTVNKNPSWVAWAEKWLDKTDRSRAAAYAAADAAAYAADAAAYAAYAAYAADAAAYAAAERGPGLIALLHEVCDRKE